MTDQTVLFGLGAAKAGSTWLYKYLDSHPQCAMPQPKELHYFDALDDPAAEWQIGDIRRTIRVMRAAKRESDAVQGAIYAQRIKKRLALIKILQTPDETHATYLNFLREDSFGANLVGDITPAYALLTEQRLQQMAQIAPKTRFVFIMRDPIDRLWSNIRARFTKSDLDAQSLTAAANEAAVALPEDFSNQELRRSDYKGTLQRLANSVPEKSVFVVFFEDLFASDTCRKLCDFLGIGYMPPKSKNVVNSGLNIKADSRTIDKLRRLLAAQYTYINDHFTAIPARWRDNMIGL